MRPRSPLRLAVGLAILATLAVGGLAADSIAPYDPAHQDLAANLAPPGPGHALGQDKLGRDVLSRIVYGARVSLEVGLITVGISVVVGTSVGAVAGYAAGWVDEALMRTVDVLLAFPGLLLAIGLTGLLGPSLRHVLLALCLIGWTGYARLVRGEVHRLRHREHVEAAHALGARPVRVLLRHVLPSVAPVVVVQATFGMGAAIVAEASLSFLGLGVQPPTPSWGSMLNDARPFVLAAPHLTVFPGLAIMLTVLGINLLGEDLRDRLDVRLPSDLWR